MVVIPGMLDPYPPRREFESQGQACRDVLEQGSWQDLGFPKSIFWMKRPAGGSTAPGQGVSSAMVGTTPASVVQPAPCGSQSCPVWREVLSTQDSKSLLRAQDTPSPSQSLFLRLLLSTHPVPLAMVQKLERRGRFMDGAPPCGPGQAVPGGLLMALHRALQVCRLGPFPSSQSGVGGHASPAKPFSSLGGRGLAKGGDLNTSARAPLGSEPRALLPSVSCRSATELCPQEEGHIYFVASAAVRVVSTASGLQGKPRAPALGQKLPALGIAAY